MHRSKKKKRAETILARKDSPGLFERIVRLIEKEESQKKKLKGQKDKCRPSRKLSVKKHIPCSVGSMSMEEDEYFVKASIQSGRRTPRPIVKGGSHKALPKS